MEKMETFNQLLEREISINDLADLLVEKIQNDEDIDEGLFSTIIGGTLGFVAGPALGRAIAKVLGIEKGLLFDLLTSKMVTTALGAAISNSLTK